MLVFSNCISAYSNVQFGPCSGCLNCIHCIHHQPFRRKIWQDKTALAEQKVFVYKCELPLEFGILISKDVYTFQ